MFMEVYMYLIVLYVGLFLFLWFAGMGVGGLCSKIYIYIYKKASVQEVFI